MSIETIISRFQTEPRTRIVAFGSSNTDRRIHGLHWFDWLDLGIKQTYGRVHHTINAGLGGDTTRGLRQRFDRDVALYQPHAVFITIGGNDANPQSGIDDSEYRDSLLELERRIHALGATPVFQTYYSADVERMDPEHGNAFLRFMDVIRAVATETGTILIDHHRRWEPLRIQHVDEYRKLMIDPLHVNPLGNMLIGLDLLRVFHLRLEDAQQRHCIEGLEYQRMLDDLASRESV